MYRVWFTFAQFRCKALRFLTCATTTKGKNDDLFEPLPIQMRHTLSKRSCYTREKTRYAKKGMRFAVFMVEQETIRVCHTPLLWCRSMQLGAEGPPRGEVCIIGSAGPCAAAGGSLWAGRREGEEMRRRSLQPPSTARADEAGSAPGSEEGDIQGNSVERSGRM